MGQVPAKYMLPSSPYGSSPAASVLNPVQAAAQNPQTPLLPPNFQSGGQATGQSPLQTGTQSQTPGATAPTSWMGALPGGMQSLFRSLYT